MHSETNKFLKSISDVDFFACILFVNLFIIVCTGQLLLCST